MRRNIVLCVILTIVTCGIYGIYWFVVLTNEVNCESGHPHRTSGGVSFLLSLITFGIYGWYWAWKLGEKADVLKNRYLEYTSTDTRVLYLVLEICNLNIIVLALCQYELNKMDDMRRGIFVGEWKSAN